MTQPSTGPTPRSPGFSTGGAHRSPQPQTCAAIATAVLPSPVGDLTLAATDVGLRAVLWPDDRPGRVRLPGAPSPADAGAERAAAAHLAAAEQQIAAWFRGDVDGFDLALDPVGTAFQLDVWRALRDIPPATTTSYGALALAVGRPGAARAVGAAVGRNPLSIVVPCHRVVGAAGTLTGFAGGLAAKQALLDMERRRAPAARA